MRTQKLLAVTGLFALAAGLFVAAHGGRPADHRSAAPSSTGLSALARQPEILEAYGKLPLEFEQNQGQTDSRVNFVARGNGYMLFLAGTDATLRLESSSPAPKGKATPKALFPELSAASPSQESMSATLRLTLEGSNHQAQATGLERQPGYSNYFIGNKPEQWHVSVPHYARVKYQGVYPGIDLVYYGNQGQLETDYVVSPGADPAKIALHIDGAKNVNIDERGNLVLATTGGDLSLHQPIAYQDEAGARKPVAASYVLRDSRSVGIEVASYDSRQPLIIDPVVVYSTYLGGTAADAALAVAVDASGNAYVTGWTKSTDFPVQTPLPTGGTFGPPAGVNNQETFVTKLNATGTGLVYSTYLGGTSASTVDQGNGIAVDASGDAFVTGETDASDFPVVNPYQTLNLSSTGNSIFLSELNPTGTALVYSTYFGGNGISTGLAVAVDSSGLAYITGNTNSSNFPFLNGLVNSGTTCGLGGVGGSSAFISKFNTSLTGVGTLVYSTLIGGSCTQIGFAISVDNNGVAYVGGNTTSTDFPTTSNAFQTTQKAGSGGNAFVSKVDTTLGAGGLIYSSMIGGTGTGVGGGDLGHGISVGPTGDIFLVGITGSTDFPTTPGAFETVQRSTLPRNAFVSRFNPSALTGATSLVYSSYLGGVGFTQGYGVAVDSQSNAYVTGTTSSNDFPVTLGAPQPLPKGQNTYLSVFNPTGTGLIFSTFWGGELSDVSFGMAIDKANPPNLYIAGSTTSATFPIFPTTTAFQTVKKGNEDGFVAKFTPAAAATSVTLAPGALAFGNQAVNTTSGPLSVTLTNGGSSQLTGITITFTGANATDFAQTPATTCSSILSAGANCIISVDFTPKTQAAESGQLSVTTSVGTLVANLTGTGTGTAGVVSVNPSTIGFGTLSIGSTSAVQTVTLTNNTTTALAGIAVTFTGANAADFAQAAPGTGTACTTTLAASGVCTIGVTFKPSQAALEQAVLNIAYTGPTGSPQQVALSGTGTNSVPDFSIVASPTTVSITAGQTGTFTLTVTSLNGFNSAVTAACTGNPPGSTCTLTPTSVTPAANGTATIAGSLATVASMPPQPLFRLPNGPRFPVGLWGVLSLMLALLAVWAATRRTTRKLAYVFGMLAVLSLSGCSGLPKPAVTQKGTFTVTVNATATGNLKHPATVTITVN